jgi:hypothetical protein
VALALAPGLASAASLMPSRAAIAASKAAEKRIVRTASACRKHEVSRIFVSRLAAGAAARGTSRRKSGSVQECRPLLIEFRRGLPGHLQLGHIVLHPPDEQGVGTHGPARRRGKRMVTGKGGGS